MMRNVAAFVFRSEAFVTSDLCSDHCEIVRFYTYIKFDSIAKYCITIVWFEVIQVKIEKLATCYWKTIE